MPPMRCTTRRSPRKRRSSFHRRKWASSSRSSRSGRPIAPRSPASRTAIAVRAFSVLALVALLRTAAADELADARKRWANSPHGPLLERILPPTFEAGQLPERDSTGAKLMLRYCVQCHNLPNPAMHHAAKWPGIVERMVERMEGRGNLATLMSEMMAGVSAPTSEETRTLVAYLRRHGQKPLDAQRYPDL